MNHTIKFADSQALNGSEETRSFIMEDKLPESVVITFNVIAALTVLANIFHLSMIHNQKRLHKPVYYNYRLFLICLGSMDLALAIVRLLLSNNTFQNLLEKFNVFCTITAVYLHLTYASMITLIVMVSVDRALCLKRSISYQNRRFVRRYPRIIAGIITFFAMIYTIIGFIYNGVGFSTKDVGTCNFGSHDIPILAAPTVLLVFGYLWIITGVYIYIIVLTKYHIDKNKNRKGNRRIAEVTKTIGAIIVGSALCWLPPITSAVLWGVGIPSVELEIFALIMLELNSLANPLLYGLANSTYRELVYKRLCKCFRVLTQTQDCPTKDMSVKEPSNSSSSGTTSTNM